MLGGAIGRCDATSEQLEARHIELAERFFV